mmetsp:Transcript_4586/g.6272  ORF Transcript_4586/g.6272 Transcript_4586/m.6272 type:complete len:362 (+) Transcript_4586:1065-2150(+)
MTRLLIHRASPKPPPPRSSARLYRSRPASSAARSSGATPGPLSCTSTRSTPSEARCLGRRGQGAGSEEGPGAWGRSWPYSRQRILTRTSPRPADCRTAWSRRWRSTCRSRKGSSRRQAWASGASDRLSSAGSSSALLAAVSSSRRNPTPPPSASSDAQRNSSSNSPRSGRHARSRRKVPAPRCSRLSRSSRTATAAPLATKMSPSCSSMRARSVWGCCFSSDSSRSRPACTTFRGDLISWEMCLTKTCFRDMDSVAAMALMRTCLPGSTATSTVKPVRSRVRQAWAASSSASRLTSMVPVNSTIAAARKTAQRYSPAERSCWEASWGSTTAEAQRQDSASSAATAIHRSTSDAVSSDGMSK